MQALTVQILTGVLLASVLIAVARWRRREDLFFGIGLLVTAAFYLMAALWARELAALPLEVAGLIAFGTIGLLGIRGWRRLLAVGWIAHVGWDVLLHGGESARYAPDWYPMVCVGFDLFLAGYIAGSTLRRTGPEER